MTHQEGHRPPLDNKSAAEYSGLPEGYLNKLRVWGSGPTFIKIGGRILYDPADIDAWLAANKRRSTSDVSAPALV